MGWNEILIEVIYSGGLCATESGVVTCLRWITTEEHAGEGGAAFCWCRDGWKLMVIKQQVQVTKVAASLGRSQAGNSVTANLGGRIGQTAVT